MGARLSTQSAHLWFHFAGKTLAFDERVFETCGEAVATSRQLRAFFPGGTSFFTETLLERRR
jgi:hypothetical protein